MSNESVYGKFGMHYIGEGKKCGVVEELKQHIFKWFGHMEQTEESKMTRSVYVSEIEWNDWGWPQMKWKDRVQEYVRIGVKDPWEALSREGGKSWIWRWKLFCHCHLLLGTPRSRCQICFELSITSRQIQLFREWWLEITEYGNNHQYSILKRPWIKANSIT